MRRAIAWTVGVALTLGAATVSLLTPTAQDARDPFVVSGGVGDRVVGRETTVTVDAATLAETVADASAVDAPPAGTWLVVRVSAEATRAAVPDGFRYAQAIHEGTTTLVSDRVASSFTGVTLEPGVPMTGMLAFQLPPGAEAGEVELRFSSLATDPILDSVESIRFDLASLPRAESVTIEPAAWSKR